MSGEADLGKLLSRLEVYRHDGLWAFEMDQHARAEEAVMTFREREGWTYILPVQTDTPETNKWVWLELAIHSDLNAVGFIAAVSAALGKVGVPCNAVAAFYHDHIFVPKDKAALAIETLNALSK